MAGSRNWMDEASCTCCKYNGSLHLKRCWRYSTAIHFYFGSSTQGCFSPKVVFHIRSSSTKGLPSPKVIFHQRSSSTEGHLPPTITPWLILYLWALSTYQISASYLAEKCPYKDFGHTERAPGHTKPLIGAGLLHKKCISFNIRQTDPYPSV